MGRSLHYLGAAIALLTLVTKPSLQRELLSFTSDVANALPIERPPPPAEPVRACTWWQNAADV